MLLCYSSMNYWCWSWIWVSCCWRRSLYWVRSVLAILSYPQLSRNTFTSFWTSFSTLISNCSSYTLNSLPNNSLNFPSNSIYNLPISALPVISRSLASYLALSTTSSYSARSLWSYSTLISNISFSLSKPLSISALPSSTSFAI
jgi:hypothetical protein